jgi:isoleucyl-tRNA synthetase
LGWFFALAVAQVLFLNHVHLFGIAIPLLYVYFPITFRRGMAKWETLLLFKSDVNLALEQARASKLCKKSTDAKLVLSLSDEAWREYEAIADMALADLFVVSEVEARKGEGEGVEGVNVPGLKTLVEVHTAYKCPRCWLHNAAITEDGGLCPRCAEAVKGLEL